MPRPFTPAQRLQNRAFLQALRRTGNARAAAAAIGAARATLTKRRAVHPAFAAEWDAALAQAQARLAGHAPAAATDGRRLVRLADGRVQLRRAGKGDIGEAARIRFLLALAASANVRLAAAAAGHSHAAFYGLRRRDPGFAREMRLALAQGYERLEMALVEAFEPEAAGDAAWRANEPPAIPPMTVEQAFHLLNLHRRSVQLVEGQTRQRRGESNAAFHGRMIGLAAAERERLHEAERIREAEAWLRGDHPSPFGPRDIGLPDLAQVTGWSKARQGAMTMAEVHAAFVKWRRGE